MDTTEIMNNETMETISEAVAPIAETVANTAAPAIANLAPEIRYVEIPADSTSALGAFVLGSVITAATAGGIALYKKYKKRKANKEAAAKVVDNNESIEGYERKPADETVEAEDVREAAPAEDPKAVQKSEKANTAVEAK